MEWTFDKLLDIHKMFLVKAQPNGLISNDMMTSFASFVELHITNATDVFQITPEFPFFMVCEKLQKLKYFYSFISSYNLWCSSAEFKDQIDQKYLMEVWLLFKRQFMSNKTRSFHVFMSSFSLGTSKSSYLPYNALINSCICWYLLCKVIKATKPE